MFNEALQAYNINSAIFKVGRNADVASPLIGACGGWHGLRQRRMLHRWVLWGSPCLAGGAGQVFLCASA